jgi:hypothetical protein
VSAPVDLCKLMHCLHEVSLRLDYLGGDDDIIPVPIEMFDSAAHDFLRLAFCVAFSAIEEVDPSIEGCFKTGECVVIANVSSVSEPTTKRDGRDLQSALAHEAVLHLREILRCFGFRHAVKAKNSRWVKSQP